jgi:sugar phosphate isomerase/epimerase
MYGLPFRIGTTSYILPDEILPNVHYLARQVQDVELVLFEIDDGPNNLPDDKVLDELTLLAGQHGLSYTVHLPLDLRLATEEGEQHISMQKARKVIEFTRRLNPWAYVLHLDGKELLAGEDTAGRARWVRQALQALEAASAWAGGSHYLAIENLEHYPLDFLDEIFERIPASRCIDIGHLWLDGHDPLPYLERYLGLARVLHIHGIGERDHQSLSHVPADELARVLNYLRHSDFRGVMTIEVFGDPELQTSLEAIQSALERLK